MVVFFLVYDHVICYSIRLSRENTPQNIYFNLTLFV